MKKEVYIVHAVDTEGPLYESPLATLKRAEELLNIKIKIKNKKSLKDLKKESDILRLIKKKLNGYLIHT